MHVRSVDPRDVETEIERPTYRVYFTSKPDLGLDPNEVGRVSDEYELTGASDINEVMLWAQEKAKDGQAFAVYVLHDRALITVAGTTSSSNTPRE